ncbi:phage holin family protein [Bacillus taeanensis]|nr:phage holin family protein [Bacillus taeanensis]
MAVYFYIGNEGLSILENLHALNVPIPKGIAKYIEQLSKEEDVQNYSQSSNEK